MNRKKRTIESDLRRISSCEVCGGSDLVEVLDLGDHPLCDDLIRINDSRVCKEYPIEILLCTKCITAHQRYQIPKRELFPESYHYRSRFTVDVLDGMRSLVESCQRRYGDLAGKSVLDIGCNDGSLLNFFRDKGAHTIGVEPTGAANDAITNGHQVIHDYLSPNLAREILLANGPLDFITFTNVFAHIEDLGSVLDSLEILLTEHTVLIIENHYLGAVLNGIQFDTFYHEHPRTYSLTSFQYIARRISTTIVDVDFPSRYGGNIRVFLKREQIVNEEFLIKANEIMERELTFNRLFSGVNGCFERWRSSKSEELLFLVSKHGSLRAKAFPGRAAILINTLKLDKNVISQVYEKPGSPKIGHYVPGTRISILSDNELFKLTDKSLPIVNLAWHIPLEIRSYLKQNDYCGPVIDIMSVEEVLTG